MADDGGHRVADEYEAPRSLENKRKFEDVPPEEPTTFTGGGGGGADGGESAPVTYNNVPPPMSEFQLAKERVQQIAARLVGAEGLKRPRTEESNDDQHILPHRPSAPDNDQGYSGERSFLLFLSLSLLRRGVDELQWRCHVWGVLCIATHCMRVHAASVAFAVAA